MSEYTEIFSFVRTFAKNEPGFGDNLLRRYRRLAFYARLGASLMAMLSRPNSVVKYTFVGRRLGQLILGLPRSDVQIIGNQLDYLFCRKHGISFVSNCEAWPVVTRALSRLGEDHSDEAGFEKVMKCFPSKCPGVLVLSNDSLPVERLMILAAKRARMETICIQDGLMLMAAPSYAVHGKCADHLFTFSKQQRDIFIARGVSVEKLQVMGFHSDYPKPEAFPPVRNGSERKICILGQPVSLFYPQRSERYLELMNEVYSLLEKAGYVVVYKPHPGEKGARYLSCFSSLFKGLLQEAFESFDVFISLNSTALLETTLCGRVALQLRDDIFPDDDFEQCGIAHTLHSGSIERLSRLVHDLEPFRSDEVAAMVKDGVTQRFLKTLAELEADVV